MSSAKSSRPDMPTATSVGWSSLSTALWRARAWPTTASPTSAASAARIHHPTAWGWMDPWIVPAVPSARGADRATAQVQCLELIVELRDAGRTLAQANEVRDIPPPCVVGNIVGMAYVVARPKGRYEIRESVHTPKGPRARSLANFTQLDDEVLARARERATPPLRPGRRAGRRRRGSRQGGPSATSVRGRGTSSRPPAAWPVRWSGFPPPAARRDPGDALIGLLGFAARVKPFGPARTPAPLRFPPLARLREERIARAGLR